MVFPEAAFGDLPPGEKAAQYDALRASAARRGYRGEVAAVWVDSLGRTRFLAPSQQHPFFQLVSYAQLHVQVNGTIPA